MGQVRNTDRNLGFTLKQLEQTAPPCREQPDCIALQQDSVRHVYTAGVIHWPICYDIEYTHSQIIPTILSNTMVVMHYSTEGSRFLRSLSPRPNGRNLSMHTDSFRIRHSARLWSAFNFKSGILPVMPVWLATVLHMIIPLTMVRYFTAYNVFETS